MIAENVAGLIKLADRSRPRPATSTTGRDQGHSLDQRIASKLCTAVNTPTSKQKNYL